MTLIFGAHLETLLTGRICCAAGLNICICSVLESVTTLQQHAYF